MADRKRESKPAGETQTNRPKVTRPSYLRGSMGPKKGGQGVAVEKSKQVAAPQEKKQEPEPKEVEDKPIYAWTIWLLPRRPLVSVLVVMSLAGCIFIAYWAFPQVFFVVIISLILLNRLAPFLFPMKCSLNEVTVGYRTFLASDVRPWTNFLTYHEFPDGVLLTHDTRTIRGRMREGLFLYYYPDKSNKDEILRIVQSKLKPPEQAFEMKDKETEDKGGIGSAIRRVRRLKGQ